MESMYATIDLELDSAQKASIQAVSDYAIAIGETNEELKEWELTPEPEKEYGVAYTIKETVKLIVLGGVIGVLVMTVVFAVGYVLNGKIKTDKDWRAFGLSVLGHISKEEKKKRLWRIDRWIDRNVGGRRMETTLDESCKLTAYKLNAVLQERNLSEGILIGDIDSELVSGIAEQMSATDDELRFIYSGNILTDGAAVKKIETASELFFWQRPTRRPTTT